MAPLVFRSKVDTWLKAVLFGSVAVAIAGVAGSGAFTTSAAFVAVPLLIVAVGLPVWTIRSTYYTLTDERLDVRCGPLVWSVRLNDVRSVTPTRNPLSSPALSLDRLRIDYGRGLSIMISPQDKDAFVRELETRRFALQKRATGVR